MIVKIFDPNTGKILKETDLKSFEQGGEIPENYIDYPRLIGKKEDISDVVKLSRAHQNINIKKGMDEDKQHFANYYFSILKAESEGNSKDHPFVVLMLIDHWHNYKKNEDSNIDQFFEKPLAIEREIMKPMDENFEHVRGLIYSAKEYDSRKKEHELYDDLLDMGFCFFKHFDDYINENLSI